VTVGGLPSIRADAGVGAVGTDWPAVIEPLKVPLAVSMMTARKRP
jgi:hypothetical protein